MHKHRPKQRAHPARTAPTFEVTRVDEEAVVIKHFAGQHNLYNCFREACLDQFPTDTVDLSQALANDDTRKALRIAHTLKSALLMLGFERESEMARSIELAMQQGRPSSARESWKTLKGSMQVITGEDVGRPRSSC